MQKDDDDGILVWKTLNKNNSLRVNHQILVIEIINNINVNNNYGI